MSSPWNEDNLLTAGQYASVHPSDEVGWTSEAPSRRSPKPRRSKQSPAPYATAKPARPPQKKDNPDHIPRPENSFILFRKEYVRNRPPNAPLPQGKTLSKFVGEVWKSLPAEVKLKWHRIASEVSKEHARKHPNWKYCPTRHKGKVKKQTDTERKIEESSVTFHSTESSPDPMPAPSASDLVSSNTSSLASLQVPLLPSNDSAIAAGPIHPQIVQRRQSLRLSNWEDSVLYPQDLSCFPNEAFANQSQGHLAPIHGPILTWEALRRQSSSAPLPDHSVLGDYLQGAPDSIAQPDTHDNNAGAITSYYHFPSRRTSYFSGIRPGFVYQDTVFPIEDKVDGNMLTSAQPIQPLVVHPSDLHNPCYPEISQVENNATIAPTSLGESQLAWPNDVNAHSATSAAAPFMFVSPIQPLPSNFHLEVEGNDPQFNQRWSGMPFCSSPDEISFPLSNSTVKTVNTVPLNATVTPTDLHVPSRTEISSTVVPGIEKCGETSVENKSKLVPGFMRQPRPQVKRSRPSKRSLWFNPYSYKPQKTTQPQKSSPILVEDLLRMESTEPYGSEFGQYTSDFGHSHSLGVGTDSTVFPAVSMDPLLTFFPITYDQGFDPSWGSFDGVVGA